MNRFLKKVLLMSLAAGIFAAPLISSRYLEPVPVSGASLLAAVEMTETQHT